MSTSRRDFLRTTTIAGGALAAGLTPRLAAAEVRAVRGRPSAPLRILILGGTGFIGPYQVQYALDRGHTVTLFNRGRTNPQLFPTVEKLVGDRANNLEALEGKRWDAVIDNSATNPEWVKRSAQLLKDSARQYVFISTRSVYFDTSRVPMTADAPVFTHENTKVEPGRPLPYGLSKALAEKEARQAFGDRTLILRPGLIVGPGDLTDRFTYWPLRIERGGEVLAPGDGSDPVQVIDARDLAEWTIRLLEQGDTGVYNAVGPKESRSMEELLYGIKSVTTSDARLTWVDADFLAQHKVRPYAEMPVWMPARAGREGFARFDISREIAKGLTFRPLADTARATLDYYHALPPDRQATIKAGITPEREREVLAAWHAHKSAK
jgi:2'-hydroxyisoflavone reductase